MQVMCSDCKLTYDDAECVITCPHGELMPRTVVSTGDECRISRGVEELNHFQSNRFPLPMHDEEFAKATWLLTGLANECFRIAGEHGFHEGELTEDTIPVKLCLIHSEISEALEAFRDARLGGLSGPPMLLGSDWKPEGIAVELADAIIRILDLCGRMGWDIGMAVAVKMQYNEGRKHKHGRRF